MITVKATTFNYLLGILTRYFNDKYRWKENEEEEMVYYKGKRNLAELEFMVNSVFEDVNIVEKGYHYTADNKCLGGYIIIRIFVDADFNGIQQGTKGAYTFIMLNLIETAYFTNYGSLEYLKSCAMSPIKS